MATDPSCWLRSRTSGGCTVGFKWTDADNEASRARAAKELKKIARQIADGRKITVDEQMAHEVRRRDARMWAMRQAQGRTR